MLAIPLLVRMGPWTLTDVQQFLPPEPKQACDRCQKYLREVWCLAVAHEDGTSKNWRVGNVCGPKILHESNVVWSETTDLEGFTKLWNMQTKDARSQLKTLGRITKLLVAGQNGNKLTDSVRKKLEDGRDAIISGEVSRRQLKHLGAWSTYTGRRHGLWK